MKTNILSIEPVPLSYVDPSKLSWALLTSTAVNQFFSKPYKAEFPTSTYYSLKLDNERMVYRPNHSLAHGMRQTYLAIDLTLMFKYAKKENFHNRGQELCAWIQQQFQQDPNFLRKIFFTNAFQRTGRESEIGREDNRSSYEKYLLADQQNFLMKVKELGLDNGNLFKDQNEIYIYKEALVRKFNNYDPSFPIEVFFLSKVMYSAHLLDLRRISSFDKSIILQNISTQLFGINQLDKLNETENSLLMRAWKNAGSYLKATGDRDMEGQSDWDKELFYAQAQDPEKLVIALELTRSAPEKKLLNAILSHTQVMRELKASKTSLSEEPTEQKVHNDLQQKIEDFRGNLKNAPYTASEAYLKLVLEENKLNYQEIPPQCADEIARHIINQNILNLLPDQKAQDIEYVTTLTDVMMEERKQRDKIVLYHATDPEFAVLFDMFSHLRQQIIMQGGIDSISILRAIDEEFISLNKLFANKTNADAKDFAEAYRSIEDSDRSYQAMGLATNFGLFGSNNQQNSNTYQMFYEFEKASMTWSPPNYEKLIRNIEYKTGFEGLFNHYEQILKELVLNDQAKQMFNRQLLQIFVDPQVLDETTYLSVIYGTQIVQNGQHQLSLQQPLELLRNHPETMKDYLKTRHADQYSYALALSSLQARLFMQPQLMLDSSLIKINGYWRKPLANKQAYHDAVKGAVNDILATWLTKGAPMQPDILLSDTVKLPAFMQTVYQGSTGMEPPKAPPPLPEQQLVNYLLKKQDEFAARFLDENYEMLKDKIFNVPADQYDSDNGKLDLKSLLVNCNISMPVIKVALDKNIFKGGSKVYEFLEKVTAYQPHLLSDFVKSLTTFVNPVESIELLYKHVIDKTDLKKIDYYSFNKLKAINILNNDEEWLKLALSYDYDIEYPDILCKNLVKLSSKYKDINLFKDAINILNNNYLLVEKFGFCNNIDSIIKKLFYLKEKRGEKAYKEIITEAIKQNATHKVNSFSFLDSEIGDQPAQEFLSLLTDKHYELAARFLDENYFLIKDKTFDIPSDCNFKHNLIDLLLNYNVSLPVIKVALDKNILRGGKRVYEFLEKIPNPELYLFQTLKVIYRCSDPVKTIEIFYKYIGEKAYSHSEAISLGEILQAINLFRNDEEWLKLVLPFCLRNKIFNHVLELCTNLKDLPPYCKNTDLFNDAIFLFNDNYLIIEQMKFCKHIKDILSQLYDYKKKFKIEDYEHAISLASKKKCEVNNPIYFEQVLHFVYNFLHSNIGQQASYANFTYATTTKEANEIFNLSNCNLAIKKYRNLVVTHERYKVHTTNAFFYLDPPIVTTSYIKQIKEICNLYAIFEEKIFKGLDIQICEHSFDSPAKYLTTSSWEDRTQVFSKEERQH